MSTIKVMNENLSNKIAAGEVVEKCVSIVKELVENSIDAKSSEIKVDLIESGLREIRVFDNGIGMDKEDALLAFSRHATSKLLSDDDLFNITSLGFRGEALPSIASVSEIILKTCHNEVGTLVHIKGGKIINVENSDSRVGTSVTITNLFYNTPARLKHLGSTYSELANIVDYMNKISLSRPDIKFRLTNDGKELLNTDGLGNRLKVINKIYGIDVTKKMIDIEGSNDDYNINGYISLPEVTRTSRSNMITLVNGRVIRNSELNKIINDSYHTFKEDNRYPIVVINIEVDPTLIDVNIHPSKLDIKFSNFDELKNLINKTIIATLKKKLLIPKVEIKHEIKNSPIIEELALNLERTIQEENEEYKKSLESIINNPLAEEYIEEVNDIKDKLPELYPLTLALGTYIVCQNEKGIYLIDQHAAKERINYEKYSYELSHSNDNIIEMLVPFIIEFPKNEYIIIRENIDIINKLNITVEEFGSSSFRITSHPVWFPEHSSTSIIKRIFELIIEKERDFSLEKFNDRLAMDISCKMSIKANTNISLNEMENLIDDLRKCDNPFHCPHGRPTLIHYSKYELEKLFKRSI